MLDFLYTDHQIFAQKILIENNLSGYRLIIGCQFLVDKLLKRIRKQALFDKKEGMT